MLILFDDNNLHLRFAPLTLTRPVAELRFGILTISESWLLHLDTTAEKAYRTESYLQAKFQGSSDAGALVIAGNVKPTAQLADYVKSLKPGDKLFVNQRWVASNGHNADNAVHKKSDLLIFAENLWDLYQKNAQALLADFELLTSGQQSATLSPTNRVIGEFPVFLEKGAEAECCIFNTQEGPVYLGADAEVMEGSMIRGPFALGEHSTVKMGAKIYGATTIGPYCKVGGEISNSIFQAYSNKGHDGFLGNSVIGEWCNFGADSNSSNLMNTYGMLKIHSYETAKAEQTDVMFCGVLMGDHAKTGINTMLNTATVVGVSANIFGSGFPAKYVPSFTWGAAASSEKFKLEKAFEVAGNMMLRRNVELTAQDKAILTHIFDLAR
jgi:UDP-N-acetylglucosamine diphosphorylase/glucosamine-1-phosphate N-acetyltransferase